MLISDVFGVRLESFTGRHVGQWLGQGEGGGKYGVLGVGGLGDENNPILVLEYIDYKLKRDKSKMLISDVFGVRSKSFMGMHECWRILRHGGQWGRGTRREHG